MKDPFVKVEDQDGNVSFLNFDRVVEMREIVRNGRKLTALDVDGFQGTQYVTTPIKEIKYQIMYNNN